MILSGNNEDILGFLQRVVESEVRFYCPTTRHLFYASPCENCGAMAAHGGAIQVEAIDKALHNVLVEVYKVLEYNESMYDEDDAECCEVCA